MIKITEKNGHVEHVRYVDYKAYGEIATAVTPLVMQWLLSVGVVGALCLVAAFVVEHYAFLYIHNGDWLALLLVPVAICVVGGLLFKAGQGLSAIHLFSVRVFYALALPISLLIIITFSPNYPRYLVSFIALLHSLPNGLLNIYPPFFLWLNDLLSYPILSIPVELTEVALRFLRDFLVVRVEQETFVVLFALAFLSLFALINKVPPLSKLVQALFKYGFMIGLGVHFFVYARAMFYYFHF